MQPIKADGQQGFLKLSRDISAAKQCVKLSGCAWAVLEAIILYSYGLPAAQKVSTLTARGLSSLLTYAAPGEKPEYSRKTVYNAREDLVAREIIYLDNSTQCYAINTMVTEWEGLNLARFERTREPFKHLQPDYKTATSGEKTAPYGESANMARGSLVPTSGKKTTTEGVENYPIEATFEKEKEKYEDDRAATPSTGQDLCQPLKGGSHDPNAWLIRWLLGWLLERGWDEPEAVDALRALAHSVWRGTKEGQDGEIRDIIEPVAFCDAVDAVQLARINGVEIKHPPGAMIDAYFTGSWRPRESGQLWAEMQALRALDARSVLRRTGANNYTQHIDNSIISDAPQDHPSDAEMDATPDAKTLAKVDKYWGETSHEKRFEHFTAATSSSDRAHIQTCIGIETPYNDQQRAAIWRARRKIQKNFTW